MIQIQLRTNRNRFDRPRRFVLLTRDRANQHSRDNDTLLDRRFANNALVIGEPHLRFYAGAPLIDKNQMAMGTLCIADYLPRELTIVQWSNLGRLASSITNLMMARNQN